MFRDSFKRGFFDSRNRWASQDPAWENEIIARFEETTAPLARRFGRDAVDSIVAVLTHIAGEDRRSAATLLVKNAFIIDSLLAFGDDTVPKTYGLVDQVIPYGAPLAAKLLEMSPNIIAVSDFETLARTAGLSCLAARVDLGTAVTLLEVSPPILERLGFEGLEAVGTFAANVAATTWTKAARELSMAPTRIDDLLEAGGTSLALSVYNLAARMAPSDWAHASRLVERAPSFAKVPAEGGEPHPMEKFLEDAEQLARFGGKLVLAYLEKTPELMNETGPDNFEPIKRCIHSLAEKNAEEAAAFLEDGPAYVRKLLTTGSSETMSAVMAAARDLAKQGASPARKYIAACAALDEPSPVTTDSLAKQATELAVVSPALASAFLASFPALSKRLTMEELETTARLGLSLSRVSIETASQLLIQAPALVDRVGIEGLEKVADFSMLLSRESWSTAKQLLEKCPAILDDVLPLGPPSIFNDLCSLGERIASHNARLAVSLLENSAPIIRLHGYSGLERVEELTHRVGIESWTTAASLLQKSPAILERVGFEGLEKIADAALAIAKENTYGAVSLVETSPDRIDGLAEHGTIETALHVYDLAREAATISWRLAAALVDKSPQLAALRGQALLDDIAGLTKEAGSVSWKTAAKALDMGNLIIDAIGFSGFKDLTRLATDLAKYDETAAIALVEKSPVFISSITASHDRNTVLLIYGNALALSAHSPALALRFIDKSPYFLEWGGPEGLGMIASFLDSTATEDPQKALSFLETDHPEFTDFMENIPRGLELKAVVPVLSTYLKALLGRAVEIAGGGETSTDGRKITLPLRVREFRDDSDNFAFYKVIATHQEAHLEYGSYELDLEDLADITEMLAERYGTVQEERESENERFFSLFPEPDMARDLFNLLEDRRINSILQREYPALGSEIDRMNRHELKKRPSLKKIKGGKQKALEALSRLLKGKRTFHPEEVSADLLEHFRKWRNYLRKPGIGVRGTARATAALYREIHNRFTDPYRSVRPSSEPADHAQAARNVSGFGRTSRRIEEALRSREISGRGSPRGGQEGQPESRDGADGERRPTDSRPERENISRRRHVAGKDQRSYRGSAGASEGSESPEHRRDEEQGPAGMPSLYHDREKIERLLRSAHKEKGITPRDIERRLESLHYNEIYIFLHNLEESLKKKTELESERGTTLYPEWGNDIQDYRPNWARVREQVHPANSLDFYRSTLDRHGGLLKKIRREFQMLRPEAYARLKGRYDGDDIDLDAVVDYLVDRKVGLEPSEKNYIIMDRRKRDIAVAFLIDMSKSTQGVTIEQEKESLIIMSEALNEVGDSFAVFGFSGNNRDNVDFYIIKNFDDPYNDRIKKRISSIEHRYENRDGAAIRHAAAKLRKRPERTKLMILLSDGKPVDKEYTGTYAIEDTRMALRTARHNGINAFCITVDRSAPEYLPRMYSHSRWTVIDDVNKLPEKITRIYRTLTT